MSNREDEEMNVNEIERFLVMQAKEGKTEHEALKALAEVLGINLPEFKKDPGTLEK